jgi:hypothetical protein
LAPIVPGLQRWIANANQTNTEKENNPKTDIFRNRAKFAFFFHG